MNTNVESVRKEDNLQRARNIVGWYTLVASVSGTVPIPASSFAIVANNVFMIAHIVAVIGQEVTWSNVIGSFRILNTLNFAGRLVFIEAAKALSWGTGSLWALAGLCAVGATTAGLQTYTIGLIGTEIAKKWWSTHIIGRGW